MLLVFFAPEVLLGAGMGDFISAVASKRDMREYAAEDGVPWTLAHGFLANMGGFVIQFANAEDAPDSHQGQVTSQSGDGDDVSVTTRHSTPDPVVVQPEDSQAGAGSTDVSANQTQSPVSELSSPNAEVAPPVTILSQETIAIDEKGRHLSSYGLVLDQEVRTFGPNSLGRSEIPENGEHHTFAQFKIVQGSKRFMKRLDEMMSLSILANRNLSRPWKLGPASWSVDAKNLLAVQAALSNLEPANKQMALPLYLNLAALQGNIWVLDARQMLYARARGIIKIPDLPEDSLEDKNKGDALVKILALGQIAWLIIQLISRGVSGLPSTQLEIMTLGFAACTSVTYSLLFKKPKDVNAAIFVEAIRYPTPVEALTLANYGPTSWCEFIFMERWTNSRRNYWISNAASHSTGEKQIYTIRWGRFGAFSSGFTIGALIVGGLHILAWNNIFPSVLERTLWRVSSILTIGAPFLIFMARVVATCVVSALVQLPYYRRKRKTTKALRVRDIDSVPRFDEFLEQFPPSLRVFLNAYYGTTVFLCALVYGLVRLFILVEVIRSLFFLPPEAFVATWSSSIPHAG